MTKIRVCLFGRHSRRTTFSYKVYREVLGRYFDYVTDPCDAHILVTGFIQDYREACAELIELKQRRPSLKLVVLSEEPLWDTLWGGKDINKRWTKLRGLEGRNTADLNIRHINHFNSDIFNFSYLPYFLTTDPVYISRYLQVFGKVRRNYRDFLNSVSHLGSGSIHIEGFFEKRIDSKYESTILPGSSLSVFRTRLAEHLATSTNCIKNDKPSYTVSVKGRGWEDRESPRQDLSDWHLSKFSSLLGGRSLVFSYENTLAQGYITEKLFDSIFSLNVPLYHKDETNSANLARIFGRKKIGIVTSRLEPSLACKEIFSQLESYSDYLDLSIRAMLSLGLRLTGNCMDIIGLEARIRGRKIHEEISSIL